VFSLIHSFLQDISIAPLSPRLLRGAPNHSNWHCVGAQQATVSEGLAQGPYMAARVEFEPTTLRSNGIDSTNVLPHPMTNQTGSGFHCLLTWSRELERWRWWI